MRKITLSILVLLLTMVTQGEQNGDDVFFVHNDSLICSLQFYNLIYTVGTAEFE